MAPIFLEGWARPLLVLHALAGFALLGAATHLVVVCVGLLRGKRHQIRLARVYAQVLGWTFAAVFGVGLLMYPHYRYHVRGLYLDRFDIWASNLFDMKENLAALGLPLAVTLFAAGRKLTGEDGHDELRLFSAVAALLWGLTLFAVVSGLIVTAVKGV